MHSVFWKLKRTNSWKKLFSEWLSIRQGYGGHCFQAFCRFFFSVLQTLEGITMWRKWEVSSHFLPDLAQPWWLFRLNADELNHAPLMTFIIHPQDPFYLSLCPPWGAQISVQGSRCLAVVNSLFRTATHCLTADPVRSAPPTGQLLIIWPLMLNLFVGLPSLEPRQPRDTRHVLQQIPHFLYYDMLLRIM